MPPTAFDAKRPAAKPHLERPGSDRRDAGAVAADRNRSRPSSASDQRARERRSASHTSSTALTWAQMGQRAPAAERLLKLPYHIVLVRDAEGDDERCWTARVQELPGCEARERTSEEAARSIAHAMEEWLDAALERGADIPEPRHPPTHSGRLLLRLPQDLHSEMARRAESEDVSLNGYITSLLAGTVGWPQGGDPMSAAPDGSTPESRAAAPTTRPRFLSVAIMANIVVVLAAGVAAVVLLVGALENGW
jgi:predicted RNase H-like HicB family nuclease